ncbi:MAG TPA: ABC transporter ATP-binding protein [Alphaproteobacteria bacterium]|jgi:NitT/TauT family transport system ATP-binding protein|nr:ABC transporter ATP-binding protein [Alphaproteobacteria bacterium]
MASKAPQATTATRGNGRGKERLRFENVTKRYPPRSGGSGHVLAVEGVDFAIADGEVVSLIGPSGCGKSTLLHMASGLDGVSEGRVFVDGEPVTGPNPHVAFMLQKDLLLPWRTIRENVEFGQEIRHIGAASRRERSLALLAKYHLADFAENYPHELSGGMRQRAALARTMALGPDVLLLDEPFSALDAQTKMVLQNDLARTLREDRKTALLITHDLVEAVALSDRVLVMSRRPGRIIREMIIDLPCADNPLGRQHHPHTGDFVRELMGLLDIGHVELATA